MRMGKKSGQLSAVRFQPEEIPQRAAPRLKAEIGYFMAAG
jgi:hypothetical protein